MSVIVNPTTGGGGGGYDPFITVPFTYTSNSPQVLQTVVGGQIVDRAVVVITTPFDGVNPSVLVGTTGIPDLIFADGDIDCAAANQYSNENITSFSSNDIMTLTITPSGSTQGAGLLFYIITEA